MGAAQEQDLGAAAHQQSGLCARFLVTEWLPPRGPRIAALIAASLSRPRTRMSRAAKVSRASFFSSFLARFDMPCA